MELQRLLEILANHYGRIEWWVAEPFEVMAGAILTQNTAWRNVEKALENLKAKGALNPESIARMDIKTLAQLIKPSGFYNIKAARLKALAEYLVKEWHGNVTAFLNQPTHVARAALLSIKGVGKETADSILLYAGNHPIMVIDAYTFRILERTGIYSGRDYDELQHMLMQSIKGSAEDYKYYHALFVEHAKRLCRKRPRCNACPLKEDCRYENSRTH